MWLVMWLGMYARTFFSWSLASENMMGNALEYSQRTLSRSSVNKGGGRELTIVHKRQCKVNTLRLGISRTLLGHAFIRLHTHLPLESIIPWSYTCTMYVLTNCESHKIRFTCTCTFACAFIVRTNRYSCTLQLHVSWSWDLLTHYYRCIPLRLTGARLPSAHSK